MKYEFKAVLVALVLMSAPAAADEKETTATEISSIGNERNIESLFNRSTKPAIPFVPFPMHDLISGAIVSAEKIIKTPNLKGELINEMRVGEYYERLNNIERDLNKIGYSLRGENGQIDLQKIEIDKELLKRQAQNILQSLVPVDEKTMNAMRSPEDLAKAVISQAEGKAQSVMNQIYAGSALADVPQISLKPLDPEVVYSPTPGLKNLITKSWGKQKGDKEKYYIDAALNFSLDGSLKKVEMTAKATSDVYVYKNEYNIVLAQGQARLERDSGKFQKKIMAELKIIGINVYKEVWGDQTEKPAKDVKNNKDTPGTFPVIRKGSTYFFAIGFIPAVAEVGVAGEVLYEWTKGVEEFRAVGGVKVTSRLGGYASVAVTIVVAEAGVGGQLNILDDELTIEGYVGEELDTYTGEPQMIAGVIGRNKLTLLSGKIYSFARYFMPRIGMPPYEKKSIEKVIAVFDGLVSNEKVLFDFQKVVRKGGFFLKGAPKKEDYDEVDLDESLKNSLKVATDFIAGTSFTSAINLGKASFAAAESLEKSLLIIDKQFSNL